MQVAVIHRPRYDDWTLPKGKLHAGEGELAGAVREIAEEIGASVAVQRFLGRIRYDVAAEHSGESRQASSDKRVAYWAMRYTAGDFTPNDEVDELRWCAPEVARRLMTYELDRSVLDEFASLPPADSLLLLVRHAKAGKRSEWPGPDAQRPLEDVGHRQAAGLVPVLRYFQPTRLVSAEPVRCVQTLTPLAASLGIELEIVPSFGDESYVQAPDATEAALHGLATPGGVTVVCSQGTTIPALLSAVAPRLTSTETRKSEFWVLSVADGKVVAADHYPAPVR